MMNQRTYKSKIGVNLDHLDQILRHMGEDKKVKLTVDEIARVATDKTLWKSLVEPKKPAR